MNGSSRAPVSTVVTIILLFGLLMGMGVGWAIYAFRSFHSDTPVDEQQPASGEFERGVIYGAKAVFVIAHRQGGSINQIDIRELEAVAKALSEQEEKGKSK